MKPNLEFYQAPNWREIAFSVWLSLTLDRSIVSDDISQRGRFICGGITFLIWKVSFGWMFNCKPYEDK
jgi:hypothetical protein